MVTSTVVEREETAHDRGRLASAFGTSELCNGCTLCQSQVMICSNTRISDLAQGAGAADDQCYRLTAGDVVFLTELES